MRSMRSWVCFVIWPALSGLSLGCEGSAADTNRDASGEGSSRDWVFADSRPDPEGRSGDGSLDNTCDSQGSVRECASGLPGVCFDGSQICQATGQWSECVPLIQPGTRVEICENSLDDDCDGQTDGGDSDCTGIRTDAAVGTDAGCSEAGICGASYGLWGSFSACSIACGEGTQTRTRPCLAQDGTEVSCAECGGDCEESQPCSEYSGCAYNYSGWSEFGDCLNNVRTSTRSCIRSDGQTVDCSFCGGDCERTESCCPTGLNIAAGDAATCNTTAANSINQCTSVGCYWSGPTACTIGGAVANPTLWGLHGDCLCPSGIFPPWC